MRHSLALEKRAKGTADCLFVLHGLVELLLAKGKKLYCAFIDYEKAYDYLDRAAIYTKLLQAGVSSKCVRLMKNMYDKVKLGVRGDVNERLFQSNTGLLQGESTSPILFSLFVNDIESYMDSNSIGIAVRDIIIQLLMFADDMSIFSETREGLQGLDGLGAYCKKMGNKS